MMATITTAQMNPMKARILKIQNSRRGGSCLMFVVTMVRARGDDGRSGRNGLYGRDGRCACPEHYK